MSALHGDAVIERLDLSDQVYSLLREEIIQGKSKQGARLNVDGIAARLDVSPTPVKIALRRLAAEGLVEFRPRGGAFVTELSWADIEEIFEIREMIEQYAAGKVLLVVTDADCDRLLELSESLRGRIHEDGSSDFDGFAADDVAFHATLIGLAGNARLVKLYESLHVYSIVARAHAIVGASHAADAHVSPYHHVYAEHLAIVDALRARDATALRSAIGVHLRIVREFALAAVATNSTGQKPAIS